MKKISISIFSILFALVLTSTKLSAGSIGLGVSGSYMSIEADGKETSGTTGSETDTSTNTKAVDNNVIIAGIYAEYVLDNGFAIGIESVPGSADVSDRVLTRQDTVLSKTGTDTTTGVTRNFKANAEVEDYFNYYIEVPLFSENLFAKVGYTEIDVNTNEVASENGGNYGNATLDGFMYGIGYKTKPTDSTKIKFAYEATDFDTLSLTSSGNSVASETNKITADLDTWAVKVSFGFEF
tara:strand:+ start:2681 stop:3394 length:714 start_codon:yes stop_codon:yes gene_type:complete